jgi:hypothetical protein
MFQRAAVKAQKLFHFKAQQRDVTVEMVLWALPAVTAERPHGLKYRLFCGRGTDCVVRYDNETGKGDHCHYGTVEMPYRFESVDELIEDFREDCTRLAGWTWEE